MVDSWHAETYRRFPVVFERGKGAYLYDSSGRVYLDFLSGISVTILGHCDDEVNEAIIRQVENLLHVSNLFYIPSQAALLEELGETLPWKGRVFLTNSGAESIEGALKLVRRYASLTGNGSKKIITFRGGFHGRTYGSLTATAQEKYHEGFEPMLPGFVYVDPEDGEGFERALEGGAAAVLFETIQGEGGVRPLSDEFLSFVCRRAREAGALVVCDDIQAGLGRTGRFYSFEERGIVPDVITLAKGLANGLPLGAFIARDEVFRVLGPGTHGSTFGGNPVSCAAASVVVRRVRDEVFLSRVREVGEYLRNKLEGVRGKSQRIVEVRGRGLMWGIVLDVPGKEVVNRCLERGLIVNCTEEKVIRLLPPLIVTEEQVDEAVSILEDVIGGLNV
ncbi:MAG: aspartate aminotransferase family protein [Deltaproteobacteria bacterium]|nr:MAG: aspartate aminotransferase family protein [Deltaproteobacteria bacterium]